MLVEYEIQVVWKLFRADLSGTKEKTQMQQEYSLFSLRLCCLFFFPLQQQITEAVMKIKVLDFLVLVKKKEHKIQTTVQNEALVYR